MDSSILGVVLFIGGNIIMMGILAVLTRIMSSVNDKMLEGMKEDK